MKGVKYLVDTKLNNIPMIYNEHVMDYQPQIYYNAKYAYIQIIQ